MQQLSYLVLPQISFFFPKKKNTNVEVLITMSVWRTMFQKKKKNKAHRTVVFFIGPKLKWAPFAPVHLYTAHGVQRPGNAKATTASTKGQKGHTLPLGLVGLLLIWGLVKGTQYLRIYFFRYTIFYKNRFVIYFVKEKKTTLYYSAQRAGAG